MSNIESDAKDIEKLQALISTLNKLIADVRDIDPICVYFLELGKLSLFEAMKKRLQ